MTGASDRTNGMRILGGIKSELHTKRGKCSWFGRSKTRDDSMCEEDANDRITRCAGRRKTSDVQNSCGKTVVHVPGASRRHVQREGNSKITCPTESDEMNLKRIVRYLKSAPSAKSPNEITQPSKFVHVYTDSDWAGQATTCKSKSGGVVQWENTTLTARSRIQQTVSLSSAEAELYALTTGVEEGMVTKHLLQTLGLEVVLMNHVDSQSAKASASKRGLEMKHVMLKYMYVQDSIPTELMPLSHDSSHAITRYLANKVICDSHTSNVHNTFGVETRDV